MTRTLRPILIALLLGAVLPAQPIPGLGEASDRIHGLIDRYHQAHTALDRLAHQAIAHDRDLALELKALTDRLQSHRDRIAALSPPKTPQVLIEMRLIELSPTRFELFMGKVKKQSGVPAASGHALLLDTRMANTLKSENNAITAPSLITNSGERALVEVEGGSSTHYLARRSDGSYEMKTHQSDDGISIAIVASQLKNRHAYHCVIEGRVKKTMGKTPIKKDADTIGLPITTERKFSSEFASNDGGSVCIPLFSGDQGGELNLILLVTTKGVGLPHRKGEKK